MKADKVNIGCGAYPLDGYTNVDLEHEAADVVGDFLELEFEEVEEVEMSHILEHVSWQVTPAALRHVRGWMVRGGTIRIEVPDMERIMERAVFDRAAEVAIYGIQSGIGEFHFAGFTRAKLMTQVREAGFEVLGWRVFDSEHKQRQGFPCLEVTGLAV